MLEITIKNINNNTKNEHINKSFDNKEVIKPIEKIVFKMEKKRNKMNLISKNISKNSINNSKDINEFSKRIIYQKDEP